MGGGEKKKKMSKGTKAGEAEIIEIDKINKRADERLREIAKDKELK